MSEPTGVFKSKQKDGTVYYRSSITYRGKHISLGSFSTADDAHAAYLDAYEVIGSKRFSPEDYVEKEMTLSFEKWVVLINFRDNRLYIKTPIYLKKNYFLYYYDVKTCLKFDIDDLFFYSNHKIMKRGGHLFVAEYGMQTTILSRYGVKNFAVPGRDYEFMNGDETDFRYGNIHIINKYYGVLKESRKGMPVYAARIHVNGDYIVGRYSTEPEAAIAYNRAADMLRESGFDKDFPENYIDEIDDIDYDRMYQMVKISPRFRELCDSIRA